MLIRNATAADVPAMTAILNWAVRETYFLFQKEEFTVAQRTEFFKQQAAHDYPYLVAENPAGEVVGYAYLEPHNDLSRWDGCFSNSIYVSPTAHGQGVGTALLTALLSTARADARIHTVLALITGENTPSLALHQKFGFALRGTLREVSCKRGKWLDLHYLQLMV